MLLLLLVPYVKSRNVSHMYDSNSAKTSHLPAGDGAGSAALQLGHFGSGEPAAASAAWSGAHQKCASQRSDSRAVCLLYCQDLHVGEESRASVMIEQHSRRLCRLLRDKPSHVVGNAPAEYKARFA